MAAKWIVEISDTSDEIQYHWSRKTNHCGMPKNRHAVPTISECSSSSWVAYPPDCAHVEQHFDYAIDDNF